MQHDGRIVLDGLAPWPFDDVEYDDEDHHRDEQDRRDLSCPAVLRRWMTVIGHAGGRGTVPGPRARG